MNCEFFNAEDAEGAEEPEEREKTKQTWSADRESTHDSRGGQRVRLGKEDEESSPVFLCAPLRPLR
jgi:hypothetical protein